MVRQMAPAATTTNYYCCYYYCYYQFIPPSDSLVCFLLSIHVVITRRHPSPWPLAEVTRTPLPILAQQQTCPVSWGLPGWSCDSQMGLVSTEAETLTAKRSRARTALEHFLCTRGPS